jgi:DNA-binding GntR family transcriptional regulator
MRSSRLTAGEMRFRVSKVDRDRLQHLCEVMELTASEVLRKLIAREYETSLEVEQQKGTVKRGKHKN